MKEVRDGSDIIGSEDGRMRSCVTRQRGMMGREGDGISKHNRMNQT